MCQNFPNRKADQFLIGGPDGRTIPLVQGGTGQLLQRRQIELPDFAPLYSLADPKLFDPP